MENQDITRKIIGSSMKVHSTLGSGFQEVIYQRALAIELHNLGIDFQREVDMDIHYRRDKIGTRRVDFLIENTISVELKAVAKLEDVHLAQAKNYLEAYRLNCGLLINFGAKSLEFKRLFNNSRSLPKNNPVHPSQSR